MQAPILPVSIANPFLKTPSPSSSASSSPPASFMPVSSAAAGTIFIRSENNGGGDDDDDVRLLNHSSSPEDGAKPFLPRVSSYDNGASSTAASLSYQQRRRRVCSDSTLLSDGHRRRPLGQNVGQAGADNFFLTRFCLNLFRYIGLGYRWISRFLALSCYAVLLIPGFFQVAYRYFYSSRIRRGIVYGNLPRNKLDLYLPENSDGLKPVVAFITGGAWIIGYKAWGSLLGQQLSDRDVIVACIDYRNFPQVTIGDMIKDASQGISYVCNNISEYGGDPKRIYIMGQSAGAHIAACAILEKAIKESSGKDSSSWSLSQISAYLGLSGGYNLLNLVDHFHSRGLYSSLFCSIMEGEESLRRYSPEIVVQGSNVKNAVSLLPLIILFHGTADYSIPSDASKTFVDTLQRLGAKAELILYEGKTHTDVFLQDPMRGDDKMFDDLVGILHAGDTEALAKHANARPRKRLVPEFMLQLARKVSPF